MPKKDKSTVNKIEREDYATTKRKAQILSMLKEIFKGFYGILFVSALCLVSLVAVVLLF